MPLKSKGLQWDRLTEPMRRALRDPKLRDPRLFAPEQFGPDGRPVGDLAPGKWLDRDQARALRRIDAEEHVMQEVENFVLDEDGQVVVQLMVEVDDASSS